MVSSSGRARRAERFHVLSPKAPEQLVDIVDATAHNLDQVLDARGLLAAGGECESDPLAADEPLLAACYATSLRSCDTVGDRAGLPSLRLASEPPASHPSKRGLAVHHQGFSLHVGDRIDGRDPEAPRAPHPLRGAPAHRQ